MSPSLLCGKHKDSDVVVRLKVSSSGHFVLSKEKGIWSYTAGENWVANVPVSSKYAEFMFTLSEKHTSVSVKYQLPGEELDPDALVSLSDDSDLQEMFDEYFRALKLPGTPVKTFRLRVFLFPACEEVLTPEEIEDGTNPAGWLRTGSGKALTRDTSTSRGFSRATTERRSSLDTANSHTSSLSGPPSVVTEAAWEAGFRAGQEAAAWAAEEEEDAGWVEDGDEELGEERVVWQGNLSHKLASVATVLHLPTSPVKLQSERSLLLSNPTYVLSGNSPRVGSGHFHTQDPWYNAGDDIDTPLSHAAAFVKQLPSHISIFGDRSVEQEEEDGDAEHMASAAHFLEPSELKLPSHVSAFGDGLDEELRHQQLNALAITAAALGEDIGYADIVPPAVPSVVVQRTGGVLDPLPQPDSGRAAGQQLFAGLDAAAREAQLGCLGFANGSGGGVQRRHLVHQGSGSSSGASMAVHIQEVHRVPKEEVRVLGPIGEGAFGEVSLAVSSMFGKVAVKWLKPSRVKRHLETFWREAETLAAVNHPNVLRFYGVVVESLADPGVIGIMTEYMRGGSLSQLLRSGIPFLPLGMRADIALQVVKGLLYLHKMHIVHFDLKPDNLLLDGTFEAGSRWVVADFGLSKHKWKSFVSGVHDLRGTLPYMAPELVSDPDHVNEKADVWSLGMVLWEMLTLEVPFQQLNPQQIIAGLMAGSLRPEIPDWCEPPWCALLEACLDVTPAARPALGDVARQLEAILECAC